MSSCSSDPQVEVAATALPHKSDTANKDTGQVMTDVARATASRSLAPPYTAAARGEADARLAHGKGAIAQVLPPVAFGPELGDTPDRARGASLRS